MIKMSLLVRGEHVSVVAAMGVEGVLCLKMVRVSVTGDIFLGLINPRRACTVRVTAHGLCVSLFVCLSACLHLVSYYKL